jgi:hypothetical protein
MAAKIKSSFDETGNGKFIIIKIPRKNIYGNFIDPSTLFSDQQIYRHSLRTIGYIVVFLIGIVMGSVFHDHILSIHSDHATWKIFTTAIK